MKIFSSLSHLEMKRKLLKGFFIALIGVLTLVGGGIFLPEKVMAKWGFWIFLFGLGLITWGLLPYRKFVRLQSKPNEIRLFEQELQFWANNECRLIIPLHQIKRAEYVTDPHKGIELTLDQLNNLDLTGLSKYQVGIDHKRNTIIFYYFTQRSLIELQSEISL